MKVRDELQGGKPFTPRAVRWASEAEIPRTGPVGWGRASWNMDSPQRSPDQKPWTLDADGEQWWPVEVVS